VKSYYANVIYLNTDECNIFVVTRIMALDYARIYDL